MNPGANADMTTRKVRGFAIPGYAAAAAKKGHALGPPHCRQWTPTEAREAVRKRERLRRERQSLPGGETPPKGD